MACASTQVFTDHEAYQANFQGMINLVFPHRGDFRARLTTVELQSLKLLNAVESLSRVAFVSLAPSLLYISFPKQLDLPPIWAGIELCHGDIVIHSCGDRFHHFTRGRSDWVAVAFTRDFIAKHGKLFANLDLVPPRVSRVFRSSPSDVKHLHHLHHKICRLVLTDPELILHQEVGRALEDEVLQAVVTCLRGDSDSDRAGNEIVRQRHTAIMIRFEDILTEWHDKPLRLSEISAAIGVSERTLQQCCNEFIGMGPFRYAQLRRLTHARALLRSADPAVTSVSSLAMQCGFAQFGRFAAAYSSAFGEYPSTTLRRSR